MAYLVYRMVYVSLELSQPKLLACNLLPHVYIYWGVSFRCTLFLIFLDSVLIYLQKISILFHFVLPIHIHT